MNRVLIAYVFIFFVASAVGCSQGTKPGGSATAEAHHDHDGHDHGKAHDHSGWWCPEHGVPEEICALCNPKVAADLKAKGDWCEKHGRPDSQCFIDHPEYEK